MFKLEISSIAEEFINSRHIRQINKNLAKKLLRILQRFLGVEFLVKIPEKIGELDLDIISAFDAAAILQKNGIINKISERENFSDEPFLHRYAISSSAGAGGNGADFFDENQALWRAIGEACERYSWISSKNILSELTFKSSRNISHELDILNLAGFSQEQRKNNPNLQFDDNTSFGWAKARSLVSGKKLFCPAQLVSAYYFSHKVNKPGSKNKTEPMLRWAITTGLAAGKNLEEAILSGTLEIIERDAFMISYLNKLSPPIADLGYLAQQDKSLAKIIHDFKKYKLELYVLQMPTDFPVFANLALIIDPAGQWPALSVGASADFDFKKAFLSAVSEALSVRYSLRNKENEKFDPAKIDREGRLLYWADKNNLGKIDFFLKGRISKIKLNQNLYSERKMPREYHLEKLEILKSEFRKKNYEACYKELTDKNIKEARLKSVAVFIPELQPIHLDESIPYLYGKRLKEIPEKLGYKSLIDLNNEPHPFP